GGVPSLALAAAATFSVSDMAGNATTTATGSPASITVDRIIPTLAGGNQSATPTNQTTLTFTISSIVPAGTPEPIDCATLTAADLTLTRATFVGLSAAQTTTTQCTITLTSTIAAGASNTSVAGLSGTFGVNDLAGNVATTASGFPITWTVDLQN